MREAHAISKMELPDCEADGCQWKKSVWCDRCPLRAEKYLARLSVASHPLYRQASRYLHQKKLGLLRWDDLPGIRLGHAIEIVDSERNRIEAREAKKRKKN